MKDDPLDSEKRAEIKQKTEEFVKGEGRSLEGWEISKILIKWFSRVPIDHEIGEPEFIDKSDTILEKTSKFGEKCEVPAVLFTYKIATNVDWELHQIDGSKFDSDTNFFDDRIEFKFKLERSAGITDEEMREKANQKIEQDEDRLRQILIRKYTEICKYNDVVTQYIEAIVHNDYQRSIIRRN